MAVYIARHPRNIPASYYKPIGQIIARWMYTELYIMKITGHLLGVKDPKAERLLIWGLGPDAKVQLFSSLGQRWVADQPDRTELQAIARKLETFVKSVTS